MLPVAFKLYDFLHYTEFFSQNIFGWKRLNKRLFYAIFLPCYKYTLCMINSIHPLDLIVNRNIHLVSAAMQVWCKIRWLAIGLAIDEYLLYTKKSYHCASSSNYILPLEVFWIAGMTIFHSLLTIKRKLCEFQQILHMQMQLVVLFYICFYLY